MRCIFIAEKRGVYTLILETIHSPADVKRLTEKQTELPFLKLGAYKCRPDAIKAMLQKWEGWDISDPYHPRKMDESA